MKFIWNPWREMRRLQEELQATVNFATDMKKAKDDFRGMFELTRAQLIEARRKLKILTTRDSKGRFVKVPE